MLPADGQTKHARYISETWRLRHILCTPRQRGARKAPKNTCVHRPALGRNSRVTTLQHAEIRLKEPTFFFTLFHLRNARW